MDTGIWDGMDREPLVRRVTSGASGPFIPGAGR